MSGLLLIIAMLIAAAAQAWLPSLTWLGGLRVELLPAVVVFGALTLRRGPAIGCAVAAGLAQDSLSAAPFGISALAYGAAAVLMTSLSDVLDRDLPWVVMGAGAVTAVASSFAACCVCGFSLAALLKLSALAVMSAFVTPVLFLIME